MRLSLDVKEERQSFTLTHVQVGNQNTWLDIENKDQKILLRLGDEVEILLDEAGQISVTRIEAGDRATRVKRRWLQYDVDGILKFLDTKPYAPTGRKLAVLPTGLGMFEEHD